MALRAETRVAGRNVKNRGPGRRSFLKGASSALGGALTGLLTAAPDSAFGSAAGDASAGYLPMYQRRSTDPTLPGTWYFLDRTKGLRKLVDRPSIIPVGRRSLVLFERAKTRAYDGPSDRYATLVSLPSDVGAEQMLVACLPTIQGRDGAIVPCVFHYCRGRRDGNLYGEIIADRCPSEFTVSIKLIMLLPPVLSEIEQKNVADALAARTPGPTRPRPATLGFPAPEFAEGGPSFININPGATYFKTIQLVLEKVRSHVADTIDLRFSDLTISDPDLIRRLGKGCCIQRTRLAEKSLAGVARAAFLVAFRDGIAPQDLASYPLPNDYPGLGHALLMIEDPESGSYMLGDPSKTFPYMGPLSGNVIIDRLLELDDHTLSLPSKIPWPIDKRRMSIDLDYSQRSSTKMSTFLCTASSRYGRGSAQCQAWLAKAPSDVHAFEGRMNAKKVR